MHTHMHTQHIVRLTQFLQRSGGLLHSVGTGPDAAQVRVSRAASSEEQVVSQRGSDPV